MRGGMKMWNEMKKKKRWKKKRVGLHYFKYRSRSTPCFFAILSKVCGFKNWNHKFKEERKEIILKFFYELILLLRKWEL